MVDSFFTITEFEEARFKEKASLFIGRVYPVQTIADCTGLLEAARKEFYDATHHCYAYRLINANPRSSDAGEPSGTAGIRILNAIEHFGVYNVFAVVIRYFGGTKLGVGPLGKAYYDAAYEALARCKKTEKKASVPSVLTVSYEQTSAVYRAFSLNTNIRIISTDFSDKASFNILIPASDLVSVRDDLTKMLNGKFDLIADTSKTHYV